MDEKTVTFEEKLTQLLELAKSKKNVLENKEILDFFHGEILNPDQLDQIYDFLDSNKVDVLQFEEELEIDPDLFIEEELNDEEEINAARTFLGTAYHNAALGIAATVLEKNEPGEYDTDKVPESDRKKCEELSAKAAEYFHEAYIGFLHLALSQAAKLQMVDSKLCNQLDDDHLLSTVETLTKSIEECENKEDKEVSMIVDYLDHAMEASDHVLIN